MKILATTIIAILATVFFYASAYAGIRDYSEETRKLMEEAGMVIDYDWEEVNQRQIERRNRLSSGKSNKTQSSVVQGSKVDNLKGYGSKNSYDEFHTAPVDIAPNDGYGEGGFDELHINENYRKSVWHPENRGGRIQGFDEFRYPDEM